jgi:hypothetical protein
MDRQEFERIVGLRFRNGLDVAGFSPDTAAPLKALFVTRLFHQDPSHRLGGRGEKMAAMMPALIRGLAYQSQIGLMDQGGGLKRLPWLFPGHPLGRQLTQLVVHQGEQLLHRLGIAILDRTKDLGDVGHRAAFRRTPMPTIIAFCGCTSLIPAPRPDKAAN